jgi:hypothetical protein
MPFEENPKAQDQIQANSSVYPKFSDFVGEDGKAMAECNGCHATMEVSAKDYHHCKIS